jgi:hypothetical protein
VKSFINLSARLHTVTAIQDRLRTRRWGAHDVNHSRRLELLIRWWAKSEEESFLAAAISVAGQSQGLSPWSDGPELIRLAAVLAEVEEPKRARVHELLALMEASVIGLFDADPALDDLEEMTDMVEKYKTFLSENLRQAADDAIRTSLANIPDYIGSVDSESTLEDYSGSLERLSAKVDVAAQVLERAQSAIEERIMIVRDLATDDGSWIPDEVAPGSPSFDNRQIHALFSGLLAKG